MIFGVNLKEFIWGLKTIELSLCDSIYNVKKLNKNYAFMLK